MSDNSVRQARLTWRCRRGMKELDLFLVPFIEQRYASLSESELQAMESLLEEPDPDLYNWLGGHVSPLNPEWKKLCEKIREFKLT